MKKTLFLLFTILSLFAKAQVPAIRSITGKIIDSSSTAPVQYATITLIKQATGETVNGASTDEKGEFAITGVEPGNYKLVINFVGYNTKTLNHIVAGKANKVTAIGTIKLINAGESLNAVTVVAEKSVIENKPDKIIYNVEKDVTAQTGVAADVLKKVPEVSVDVDGNVELQGSSNIRFLINGKPSTVFGNNIADVLQNIPASQIQSIEVITNPGAKYDAEGTAGIINIILKKSTAEGYNANVSLSGGTRLENGSLNISAHHGHFGVNAWLNGNSYIASTTPLSQQRTSFNENGSTASYLNQNGYTFYSRRGYQAGMSFDWDISPVDNLNGSIGVSYYGSNSDGLMYRNTITNDSLGNTVSDINDQVSTVAAFHTQPVDWNLYYKRKYKQENKDLTAYYQHSVANNFTYFLQNQSYIMPDSLYAASYGNNPGTSAETNIGIDFVQPFANDADLETGAKAVLDHITSTSDEYALSFDPEDYMLNPSQSSSLDYKRNIYAGYVAFKFKLWSWLDVKPGVRNEYTSTSAFFSNAGNVNIRSYDTWVPSAYVSHTFKHYQTLRLSYSHRIQRPQYYDLNPFVNATDPRNLSTGNPALQPETGNKIELGYSKSFEKGTYISSSFFYQGNRNDIQPYLTYYPAYTVGDSTYTNVSVTTRQNVGREDNYGLNLYASIPVTSTINLRPNMAGFERYITNGALAGGNVHGFNYRININATDELTKTLVLEAFGSFNSPRVNVQGTYPSFTSYNFAVRKQFWDKKGSIALTATNPFNEYVPQRTELTGDNFMLTNLRNVPYRSFGVNFTYKFGKLEFKKEKDPEEPKVPENQEGG